MNETPFPTTRSLLSNGPARLRGALTFRFATMGDSPPTSGSKLKCPPASSGSIIAKLSLSVPMSVRFIA